MIIGINDLECSRSLDDEIIAWNASREDSRVFYGGTRLVPGTVYILSGGTASPGRTFVSGVITDAMRQDGYVRSVWARIGDAGTHANAMKFKIMRPNGTGFDLISESEFVTPTGSGLRVFNLDSPMACEVGDRLAVFMKSAASGLATIQCTTDNIGSCYRSFDDAVSGSAFGLVPNTILMWAEGARPFAISIGASTIEGHNTATPWHSAAHGGPSGNPLAEPLNQVRELIPSLTYQNMAIGGATWASMTANAGGLATLKPRAVIVACGGNDVASGRTLAQIEADMYAFLAKVPHATRVFLCELLPQTAFTDAQANYSHQVNALYASWCEDNYATLVHCHDAMAQIRQSTGALDDLVASYNYDGSHLTLAGVDAFAGLISDSLSGACW